MALPVRFRRIGRGFHPSIATADDLHKVIDLDDAYWVATAVPVASLRGDATFYKLLDVDGDGRIRSDELRAGLRWLFDTLSDRSGVSAGSEILPIGSVRADAADGPSIVDAARKVAGSAYQVDLAQARKALADEEARGLSAAGKVLPAAAGDDAVLQAFLEHVLEVTGGEPHPSGQPAVTRASVDAFLAQGAAWLAWTGAGHVPDGGATDVMPLGAATGAAHAAVEAIADKMTQYLLLCDAVALDADLIAKAKVDPTGTDLLDPAQATALLVRAPLAPPRPDGILDPSGPLNPAWRAQVLALFDHAVRPLAGDVPLDRATWESVRARLAPYAAWSGSKPATKAGDRGDEVLAAHTGQASLVERTDALLAASVAGAVTVDGLRALEKLILFQSRMLRFANNMVAMPDLFDTSADALFEHGRLVLDGREFDLSVRVTDAARAEKFGAMSPIFTMFVMVGEKGGTWTDQLAVPVTAGERGHLVEGQWGVFFPTDGGELHAQIRKIAVSPISIKEALMAPFRRIGEAIQKAADSAASAQETSMSGKVDAAATDATTKASSAATSAVAAGEAKTAAVAAPPPPPAEAAAAPAPATPPPAGGGIGGQIPLLVAGGGIALAAVGAVLTQAVSLVLQGASALAAMVVALPVLSALPAGAMTAVQVLALPLSLLLILAGLILVPFLIYAIPISIATWLRLRRRDLAALLEGAGFAVNTRLYLERSFAVQLTRKPAVMPTDLTR